MEVVALLCCDSSVQVDCSEKEEFAPGCEAFVQQQLPGKGNWKPSTGSDLGLTQGQN